MSSTIGKRPLCGLSRWWTGPKSALTCRCRHPAWPGHGDHDPQRHYDGAFNRISRHVRSAARCRSGGRSARLTGAAVVDSASYKGGLEVRDRKAGRAETATMALSPWPSDPVAIAAAIATLRTDCIIESSATDDESPDWHGDGRNDREGGTRRTGPDQRLRP